MQAFDDVIFPLSIGREASVSPAFSTQTVESVSGHERRSSDWADARLRYDAGPGVRSESDLVLLLEFFRARRGAARCALRSMARRRALQSSSTISRPLRGSRGYTSKICS